MTLAAFPWTLCIFQLPTENMHNGKKIATKVFMLVWGCFHKTATETTLITSTGHVTITWHGAACVDGEINKKTGAIFDCKQQRNAAVYLDLQEEMRERGKYWAPDNGELSNRDFQWRKQTSAKPAEAETNLPNFRTSTFMLLGAT